MARATEFRADDLMPIEPLIRRLTGKKGWLERRSKAQRWLVAKPADGEPDVSVELNIDEEVLNLVITMTGFEPGKPVLPRLEPQGVSTPKGWQLMADVGWVLGWRAPKRKTPEEVLRFAFRVVKALGLEPADGRWAARVEGRPPRPGWQTGAK